MDLPLQDRAGSETVQNVYLFVADSARAQAVSDAVTSIGVSGRAIAPSTYTASSFPAIVSGQYPATHCVWSFDDHLSERPPLLDGPESFGMLADTIWTDLPPAKKPPFSMINATNEDARPVEALSSPFVAVEHHKGGHMPYGYSFDEYPSTEAFFAEEAPSLSDLPGMYEQSVLDAEERFLTAVDDLEDRNLLEDTLVMYTSDHGEALGEAENAATIGHGDPISPDLVEVPLVFAGAGLPDDNLGTLASGTDIAPTALSSLGRGPIQSDGCDLWTSTHGPRHHRSERWVRYELPVVGEVDRYRGSSVWDASGGIVFQHGSRLARLALALGNEFYKAPWSYLNRDLRRPGRWAGFFRGYLSSTLKYGNPGFSAADALEETEEFIESNESAVDAVDREQLRKLGYLE